MKPYVIIGNGVAATGCIDGIRSIDPDGQITVISEEEHEVYSRPLISYYLEGRTDVQRMKYRREDDIQMMGCDVLYGRKAVSIDPAAKMVVLDDRTTIPYRGLCVAAGSSPVLPSFAGLETVKNKFTFQTIDDTVALKDAVSRDSKVLIIGAGLIGLKCAEGLKDSVASVTVCDLSDHILSSILDAEFAGIVQKHLESKGIRFSLCDTAERLEANTATMRSGQQIPFDILVLAVGVRANTALVQQAGGETEEGILINDRMETTLSGIYAAGDCTQGFDLSCGQKRVLAILPNAYMQGKCAGINMVGGDSVLDNAIPMNSLGFFGLHLMTAGNRLIPEEDCEIYEEKSENARKKLFIRDGVLVGYILIGNVERAGIYTALIREQTPLCSVDFDLLKKTPTLAAFSSENRRKNLGGVV